MNPDRKPNSELLDIFFLKIRGEKCLPNSEEDDEEVLGTVHRGGKAGHGHCLQGKGIGDDTSG